MTKYDAEDLCDTVLGVMLEGSTAAIPAVPGIANAVNVSPTNVLVFDTSLQKFNVDETLAGSFDYNILSPSELQILVPATADAANGDHIIFQAENTDYWFYVILAIDGVELPISGVWVAGPSSFYNWVYVHVPTGNTAAQNAALLLSTLNARAEFAVSAAMTAEADSVAEVPAVPSALNRQIAAVEAEKIAASKAVTPTLAPVLDTSYFYQTWTDKVLNVTPGIFYGIEDVAATDGGGAVAKLYKIFVELVFVDSGRTNDSSRRMNRYARALEELFAKAFAPALGHGNVKIDQVRPMAFKLAVDSDDEVKVCGISLLVSLV